MVQGFFFFFGTRILQGFFLNGLCLEAKIYDHIHTAVKKKMLSYFEGLLWKISWVYYNQVCYSSFLEKLVELTLYTGYIQEHQASLRQFRM